MGGRKSWYEVICSKHGKYDMDVRHNIVRVSPKNNTKNIGCPLCKKEKNGNEKK